jgi:hypothetical protein
MLKPGIRRQWQSRSSDRPILSGPPPILSQNRPSMKKAPIAVLALALVRFSLCAGRQPGPVIRAEADAANCRQRRFVELGFGR